MPTGINCKMSELIQKSPENDTAEDTETSGDDNITTGCNKSIAQSKKLSALDSAILILKRAHPEMSAWQIGKMLKKHNLSKNIQSVYTRLKKNDYLHMEFHALTKHSREAMIREDLPLARKKLRKILKNQGDKIPAAVEMQAIKLVYDKSMADVQDKGIDSPVQIQNIEKLQILIHSDITDS